MISLHTQLWPGFCCVKLNSVKFGSKLTVCPEGMHNLPHFSHKVTLYMLRQELLYILSGNDNDHVMYYMHFIQ